MTTPSHNPEPGTAAAPTERTVCTPTARNMRPHKQSWWRHSQPPGLVRRWRLRCGTAPATPTAKHHSDEPAPPPRSGPPSAEGSVAFTTLGKVHAADSVPPNPDVDVSPAKYGAMSTADLRVELPASPRLGRAKYAAGEHDPVCANSTSHPAGHCPRCGGIHCCDAARQICSETTSAADAPADPHSGGVGVVSRAKGVASHAVPGGTDSTARPAEPVPVARVSLAKRGERPVAPLRAGFGAPPSEAGRYPASGTEMPTEVCDRSGGCSSGCVGDAGRPADCSYC